MKDNLEKIVESLRSKINVTPEIGIIISKGMGEFLDNITDRIEIPYSEIGGLTIIGTDGDKGRYYSGYICGKPVLVMYGRLHGYKGYKMLETSLPIYAMKELGCKTLIIGGCSLAAIDKKIKVGDLFMITDHINFTGHNPLYGNNFKPFGEKFFDMSNAYSPRLIGLMDKTAKQMSLKVKRGVYAEFPSPTSETPAEIRAIRTLGAEAIGFHVVNSVIAARYAGLEVAVVGVITNYATAYSGNRLKYSDIEYNRQCASGYNSAFLTNLIQNLD